MKTIAICNHKGGVGKTALSMAIAEGLHRKGKRTLLVDLDQQMNATQQAKIDTTDEVTVWERSLFLFHFRNLAIRDGAAGKLEMNVIVASFPAGSGKGSRLAL